MKVYCVFLMETEEYHTTNLLHKIYDNLEAAQKEVSRIEKIIAMFDNNGNGSWYKHMDNLRNTLSREDYAICESYNEVAYVEMDVESK